MQYTDRFGNSVRNDGGPGSGPQGGSHTGDAKVHRDAQRAHHALEKAYLQLASSAASNYWKNSSPNDRVSYGKYIKAAEDHRLAKVEHERIAQHLEAGNTNFSKE